MDVFMVLKCFLNVANGQVQVEFRWNQVITKLIILKDEVFLPEFFFIIEYFLVFACEKFI